MPLVVEAIVDAIDDNVVHGITLLSTSIFDLSVTEFFLLLGITQNIVSVRSHHSARSFLATICILQLENTEVGVSLDLQSHSVPELLKVIVFAIEGSHTLEVVAESFINEVLLFGVFSNAQLRSELAATLGKSF